MTNEPALFNRPLTLPTELREALIQAAIALSDLAGAALRLQAPAAPKRPRNRSRAR